jgi:hypothetical protein
MADEPITTGSVYDWQETFTKDGALWDLTNAVVTFYFHKPDGSVLSHTATNLDPPTAGTAKYRNPTTEIDVGGLWYRAWRVVDGAITQYSAPRPFTVVASP